MKYGLIGFPLGHSYSKIIHEYLRKNVYYFNYEYELYNISDLDSFIMNNKNNIYGLNVTIPYKEKVIKYLDELDEVSLKINAVNTIKNDNGILKGYNTDYYGFDFLLNNNKVSIQNKQCLVLGDGGASKAIIQVLKDKLVSKIYCSTRKDLNNYNKIKDVEYVNYNEIKYLENINIIINTTSVGMYPKLNECIDIDFNNYQVLDVVIDIIYNPYRTLLLQKANEKGIITINGLDMLIYQAMKSFCIFNNVSINNVLEIYKNIYQLMDNRNIVLIGMSGAGKTFYGKELSKVLNKELIDTDEEIEKLENRSIKKIFNSDGEKYFRDIEKKVVKEVSLRNNIIISTGGGVILDEENMTFLKANGNVIFINTDINKIINNIKDDKRPLIKNKKDIERIYNERLKLYVKYSDESRSL